jgi:sentrin-specific protease 8
VQEPDTMRDGGLGKLHKKMRRFGDTLNPEDAYLSYYDIRLTREDMQTLKNDWLTDNVGCIVVVECMR